MRISDWSSDVCLPICPRALFPPSILANAKIRAWREQWCAVGSTIETYRQPTPFLQSARSDASALPQCGHARQLKRADRLQGQGLCGPVGSGRCCRAADRKSTRLKLQSLLRISYAVFCLKQKKNKS